MIITERLSEVLTTSLDSGGHKNISDGMCVMEAVAYVAGEPWSDHPACACPVISTFLRSWNDALPDEQRTDLLRPMIPLMVGTRSTPSVEQRRATMAADWLVRVHTPAWLRLAGLTVRADALAGLPEITDFAQCPWLMPALNAVRTDADAAGDAAWAAAGAAAGAAAWDAAWSAARVAARAAAWDAAGDAVWAAAGAAAGAAAWAAAGAAAGAAARAAARAAAGAAAWDAAWSAARVAARAASGAAAWAAAWSAARVAARAASGAALKPTREALQVSALDLVHCMIAVGTPKEGDA